MQERRSDWSHPRTCGWCGQITSSAAATCLHCERVVSLAWVAPLEKLLRWLRLLIKALLLMLLGWGGLLVLFHLTPLIVTLPIFAVMAGGGGSSLAATSARRPD